MSFTLDKVVPWGRSYHEYVAMFSLTKADLNKRILGCGDGPASFNAELTKIGGKVVKDKEFDFALCSHFLFLCRTGLPMRIREGAMSGRALVLRGICKKCGQETARVIEPDE